MVFSIRQGWRLAGMKAEMEFLAQEKFTGTVEYRMNGNGMERTLRKIETGQEGHPGPVVTAERLAAELEGWIAAPDAALEIFFTKGQVKRVES